MRKKTPRKTEFIDLPNAYPIHPGKAGKWKSDIFLNDKPIVLEIGCGKAEFSVAFAQTHPDINYIAMDNKSDRLWFGAKLALKLGVHNIKILRANVEHLEEIFSVAEIDALWITFPDPFPKARHAPRRLTAPAFFTVYKRIVKPGGWVHFKTDNAPLFDFTLDGLADINIKPPIVTRNLHSSAFLNSQTQILTNYERRFMDKGLPIHYLAFRF